jgi:putative ABC transport system permease protein
MGRPKIPLAWLQLSHEKVRLLVALGGIGFAAINMFMQLGFQDSLYDSNTRTHERLQGDLFLLNTQSRSFTNIYTFSWRRLYQAQAVQGVQSVSPLYTGFGSWRNPQTHRKYSIYLFGVDPGKPAFNLPEVNQNLDKIKQTDVVLFDRDSRREFGSVAPEIEQGRPVITEVNDRQVKVAGLFSIGTSFAQDGNLITSDLNFLRLVERRKRGDINMGLITLKPGANLQKTREALQAQFSKDLKILTRPELIKMEKDFWAENQPIGFIFTQGVVMGLMVGAVIVYQVLYSDVSEHLAEYATLKAVGFTDIYLLGIVFQEALILAVLGYVPGFVLAIGLYAITKSATLLPIGMTLARSSIVFGLTVLMCFISGAIAVRKLQSADPADIF